MADDSEQSITPTVDERAMKISNIGPWELGKVIGKGSSGTVRIAHHKVNGQVAAVKIMSTEAIVSSRISVAAGSDEADRLLQSIEREIVIMKLIEHPNVLGLLDVWEAKGLLFVVMEYIDGGELFDHLVERGRLPVPEALHYFQQVIYAVAYCHQFKIAHRDLKPENILLDADKNVKVADFGMAAFVPRDSLLYTSCGSPHYASPEVVSGLPYKGSVSDIWSCGVILYALLAGRLPFDDEDIRALLGKVREGKYFVPTDIPWPAQNLIRRMMEKDVERRIEISEVLGHPFFRSIPPRAQPILAPTFADLSGRVPFGFTSISIDSDIMKNMRTLWRNRQDGDIVRAICNKQDNWEKIAYHLLYEFRMKRLQCISPDNEGHRARSRQKSKERTCHVSRAEQSIQTNDSPRHPGQTTFGRPSAPTPTRARSQTVSADCTTTDEDFSILNITAPLTPRKRVKTVPESGSNSIPEIIIQHATPGRIAQHYSTDSLLDYEDISGDVFADSRLKPCNLGDSTSRVTAFVPITAPEMQEDVFFQQIAEMLVTMSKQDEPEANFAGKSKLGGERNIQTLKLPASVVAPPPTTPVTPVFSDVDVLATPPLAQSTIRTVPQAGILTPVNIDKSVQVEQDSSLRQRGPLKERVAPPKSLSITSATTKENVPFVSSGTSAPHRERARAMTVSVTSERPQPRNPDTSKKRVHIVTPDPSVFVRPKRKRSQSVGKDTLRPSDNWFSNLFHLKPSRQELYSIHDVFSTRERCVSSLQVLGARVKTGDSISQCGGSTLKCLIEEVIDPSGTVTISKALRFRVEIRPSTGTHYAAGFLSELVLVHEKGQPVSFTALCARLRRGWELDVPFQPDGTLDILGVLDAHHALPSPALTVGGRYAEI